jgi:prepilin peptidase CpaA
MSLTMLTALVIFPASMAYAAASDLVTMTISNRLCLVLVATFVLCAALLGLSWNQIALHLAAGALVLVACFGMFAAGWIGGGDAKLFAAAALWLGWSALLPFLAVTAIAGGALAFSLLVVRSGWFRPLTVRLGGWVGRLATPGENVPYGVAIAVGALVAFPTSLPAQLFPGLS